MADQAPESAVLNRTWIVDKHIMVEGSALSEDDAKGFHGRTVELDAKGYMSPWHGTCAEATRTLTRRPFVDVVDELEVEDADRSKLQTFGFDDDVAEFRLTCNDRPNPPPFLVFVSNGKAMTCFRGACYLLIQF
ncbi:MAG: hypothetical protein JWP01_2727 [Myxococcales bacterium]|nr:hypothetical protein [Myxococcales bacterium]